MNTTPTSEEDWSTEQERHKSISEISGTLRKGQPVKRQEHILDKSCFMPFITSWLDMTFSFLVIPITLLVLCVVHPLIQGIVYLLNCCSRRKLKAELGRSGSLRIEKLNGHEYFWLADSSEDSSTQLKKRLKCCSVVIITIKNNKGMDVKELRRVIQTKVVEPVDPKTNAKLYPRFSDKLAKMACGRAWVEDLQFNIENHVIEYAVNIVSTKQLFALATESATGTFPLDKPRWRLHFIPFYPQHFSTIIFSCDPAMADGVYLMHVLHNALVDTPPAGFARRSFGSFNHEFDRVRAAFNGVTWFFRNLKPFKDGNDIFNLARKRLSEVNLRNSGESKQLEPDSSKPSNQSARKDSQISENFEFPVASEPSQTSTSGRKFLVYGPISLEPLANIRDVTKATHDELVMTVLTSSLRDYLQHVFFYDNPFDISANISVALQAIPLSVSLNGNQLNEELGDPNANVSAIAPTDNGRSGNRADESLSPTTRELSRAKSEQSRARKIGPSNILPPSPEMFIGEPNTSSIAAAAEASLNLYSSLGSGRSSDQDRSDFSSSNDFPIVIINKPRSMSVGVVPQTGTSASRAFFSQVHHNQSNAQKGQESQGYAKTIAVTSSKKIKSTENFVDPYASASSSPLSHQTRLSAMKLNLPCSVEGVLPSLWHIKHRIIEEKVESAHIALYICSKFFGTILPEGLHTRLMKRLYGPATLSYHSLIGSDTRLSIEGNPIRNIFFWGPLKSEESIGASFMTYLNNMTITLNVDETIPSPEIIFQFFTKKLEDIKELLKNRRIKHQPRMETILIPFTRRVSWHEETFDDDTGEEVELRRRRSSRFKTSFGSMRRSSFAALNTLVGTSSRRSRVSVSSGDNRPKF